MITTTASFEDRNESGGFDAATREFSIILIVLRSLWTEYQADPLAQTARGLLATRRGKAYPAHLTFNDKRRHMSLMVRLPLRDDLTMPRLQVLLRLQNRTRGLAFVTFDAEDKALLLVSRSALPRARVAKSVVRRVVADARRLLEDEALAHLLN